MNEQRKLLLRVEQHQVLRRNQRSIWRAQLAANAARGDPSNRLGHGRKRGDFPVAFGHCGFSDWKAHVAFLAQERAAVDAFHGAALAHGGVEEGAPGPRPHYHKNHYGAYVRDPDGNKIQAVCHRSAG
ncbi:MAG: VOC family protein [Alphaproteobacteria bacterium]|nr:VOC family protein [Alphaproteobacteria bacterium]